VKVLADKYSNTPVRIEEVAQHFKRPCFFVTISTSSQTIKNNHVYQNDPNFQIVYFGNRNEADQVVAEPLYQIQEELTALFLLRLSVPVIPVEGVTEKPRYAKVESFTSDIRLDEGAVYAKLVLNFTDDVPHEESYDLIDTVELDTKVSTK
jgi:hypothetical protein